MFQISCLQECLFRHHSISVFQDVRNEWDETVWLILYIWKMSCLCFDLGMCKNQCMTYFLPREVSITKAPCFSQHFWPFPFLPGSIPLSSYSSQMQFLLCHPLSGTHLAWEVSPGGPQSSSTSHVPPFPTCFYFWKAQH